MVEVGISRRCRDQNNDNFASPWATQGHETSKAFLTASLLGVVHAVTCARSFVRSSSYSRVENSNSNASAACSSNQALRNAPYTGSLEIDGAFNQGVVKVAMSARKSKRSSVDDSMHDAKQTASNSENDDKGKRESIKGVGGFDGLTASSS